MSMQNVIFGFWQRLWPSDDPVISMFHVVMGIAAVVYAGFVVRLLTSLILTLTGCRRPRS